MEELVRAIAEILEPGNWDFELSRPPPTTPAKQTFGPYRSDDHRIARIRQWRDNQLIIVAPDYFHRQIGGSGRAIMPTIESLNDRAVPQPGVTVVGLDTRAKSSSILADIARPPAAAEDDDHKGPPIIRGSMVGQAFYEHAVRTLLERQISFSFNETPAREAFAEVQTQLGLPVIGRFADDELGYGIDPKLPITLLLDDVPAIDGLETLLEQCGMLGEACTWQIRRGYLEVGTKKRLSVPAARTLRLYYIRDLMLDIHDFNERPKTQLGIALDQIDTIVNTIEPEAWDWGQVEYYQADDERVVRSRNDRPASGESNDDDDDVSPADRPRPEYVEPLRPATIRHWRDVLIVLAPDYIHRQLGGVKPR